MSKHESTFRTSQVDPQEAQDIIAAIRDGQTDAVVSNKRALVLRLREAEEALDKKDSEIDMILEHCSELVASQDTEHTILWANRAYLEATGLTRSQIKGKKCYQAWQRPEPCKDCPAEQAIKSGTPQQGETTAPDSSGSLRCRSVRAFPIKDDTGNVTGAIEFTQDITQHKRRQELAQALHTIDKLVHSSLNFDAMMQRVLAQAAKALHCDTAAMSTKEDSRWTLKFVHGFPPDIVGMELDESKEKHALLALESNKPFAVSDAHTDRRIDREYFKKWGVRAVLVVPILTRGQRRGVLYFNYHENPFQFEPEHIDFAEKLASSITLATANIQLFDHIKLELAAHDRKLKSRTELLDLAHDVIIVHDLDGKITFWNKGAEKLYGWKRDEVQGKTTHEVLKTRFREPMLKIISAVSRHGKWEGELEHKSKNRKRFVVESRWALQKDDKGRPSAILIIERDITARKEAEVQREDARQYAESIIETIQEGLLVLDSKLKVLSANQAFYRFFSLSPDRVEGRHIYAVGNRQFDIPDLRKLLGDILPKNSHFEKFEMVYTLPDGAAKTLMLNARRIHRQSQKTDMILLAMHDITEQRQYEARIRQLSEELLAAEESQRQQIATALHDSVGQLLAVSKRQLETLLKKPDERSDDIIAHLVQMISESIKETRTLTTDLSSPTLHTFGLAAAVEELAEQMTDDYGLPCRMNTVGELDTLEKKIELILYRSVKELLFNTLKHAEAKQVDISLKTEEDYLIVTVADDGKGFDTSQLSSQEKPDSFGLFSIQERLTNIGGSLTIKSAKDSGTTVILRTPLTILRSQ